MIKTEGFIVDFRNNNKPKNGIMLRNIVEFSDLIVGEQRFHVLRTLNSIYIFTVTYNVYIMLEVF